MLRTVPLPGATAREKTHSLDSLDGLAGFASVLVLDDPCDPHSANSSFSVPDHVTSRPLLSPLSTSDPWSADIPMSSSPPPSAHPSPLPSRSPTPFSPHSNTPPFSNPWSPVADFDPDTTATQPIFPFLPSSSPSSTNDWRPIRRTQSSTFELPEALHSTQSLVSEVGTASTGLALSLRKRDARFAELPSPPPSPPSPGPYPHMSQSHLSERWWRPKSRTADPPRKKARTRPPSPSAPSGRNTFVPVMPVHTAWTMAG